MLFQQTRQVPDNRLAFWTGAHDLTRKPPLVVLPEGLVGKGQALGPRMLKNDDRVAYMAKQCVTGLP